MQCGWNASYPGYELLPDTAEIDDVRIVFSTERVNREKGRGDFTGNQQQYSNRRKGHRTQAEQETGRQCRTTAETGISTNPDKQ